ncbi:MAG: hypothetical protein M3186_11300 [Actinomycetota bacterium]|nr:hypothetical protein [Actinomycetota bacterium]
MAANNHGAALSAKQLENPERAVKASQGAINAGNTDRMVSRSEPEALFVSAPEQVAVGSKAIRETFAGLLAAKPTFELNIRNLHEAGDIALQCLNGSSRAVILMGMRWCCPAPVRLSFAGRPMGVGFM